jgi:hypothetical protein
MLFYLYEPIKWEPTNNDIREKFEDWENCKNYPISQPFGVIILLFALYGLSWDISRIHKPNSIADKLCSISKNEPQSNDSDRT